MNDLHPLAPVTKDTLHIKGGMTYVAEYFWREFI